MTECVLGKRQNRDGYSLVASGRRGLSLLAHRVVWIEAHGEVPPGHHLHHRCENRACVNIDHLELLTFAEHAALHRKCDHDDRRPANGGTGSYCRICKTEKARERRAA